MGRRVRSCFSACSGCWSMPNNPIVDDYETTHLPEPSLQNIDAEQMRDAIDSYKQCDIYLKHAIEYSNQARKMVLGSSKYGKIKLNLNQCEYLVERLEIAVRDTKKSFLHSSREHEVECLEALKFLHRLAKEVESFIQTCCCNDKTWLQIALTSTAIATRVSSIGYYLKLCTMLLHNWNILGVGWLTFFEMKLKCPWEVDLSIVQDEASLDEVVLLRLLESDRTILDMLEITKVQMLSILRNRMKSKQKQQMSTVEEDLINFWEIDPKSLILDKVLGRGAFAIVIKAKWLGDIEVVEKLYENDINVIMKAVSSFAKLSHPNIVSMFGITIYKGIDKQYHHSIVQELMDGDLRTLMQQRLQEDATLIVPFSVCEACDFMLQIAEGVHYMHKNRVMHRNLKSLNVLVRSSKEDDNRIVYSKLGNSMLSKVNVNSITILHPTWMVGTIRWMAPELYGYGNENITTWYPYKSDVYSFGILCYEILTGNLPFKDLSLKQIKTMVLAGERPPLPSNCPSDLKNLIELCWDPISNTRPSFAEICEELRFIKCSLYPEPIDQRLQAALPIPKPLDLPREVLQFKTDYSSLKVVRLLAKGGSDVITLYVTSWQQYGAEKREVAQKTFLGAHNKSFVNELSILVDLNDDNIIHLLCYATDRRSCSIVMDLMDGDLCYFMNTKKKNLKDNSACRVLFSMPEALHIMVQIAQGMQYIHDKRIVHRDLKSMNILVKANSKAWNDVSKWDVKVADFEMSKKMKNRVVLNKALAIGTIRWTAPEIVQEVMNHVNNASESPSKYDYDPFKCDVYSFGMVCYEILTGNVPFHDIEDLEDVKEKILDGTQLPLSLPEEMSPNVRDLVEKCWLKEANERPSFVEIVKVLKAD